MNILLAENVGIPGTYYKDTLILGGGSHGILSEMDLHETTENGIKLLKFRGRFQEADATNKNNRIYPKSILESNVEKLHSVIKENGLIGELDHPESSVIHFEKASHKITKLWWENNTLMGEGVVLSTPAGSILRALINDGVRIGMSSRGVGNGKVNEDGVLVIGESYKLVTFDVVADPSTREAYQEVVAKKSENYNQNYTQFAAKNETTSIHTTNKDLFLACIGSIIREETNSIKERLNNG